MITMMNPRPKLKGSSLALRLNLEDNLLSYYNPSIYAWKHPTMATCRSAIEWGLRLCGKKRLSIRALKALLCGTARSGSWASTNTGSWVIP